MKKICFIPIIARLFLIFVDMSEAVVKKKPVILIVKCVQN